MRTFLTGLVLSWTVLSASALDLIPTNQIPFLGWSTNTVGIPGGINSINTATQFCNAAIFIPGTNIVAIDDPTDTINSRGALQAAINLCPANAYIYLPTGNYRSSGPLLFENQNRNNRGIKGDGMTNTVINFHNGNLTFDSVYWYGIYTNIFSGATRGSTNISTLPRPYDDLFVGMHIVIDSTNHDDVTIYGSENALASRSPHDASEGNSARLSGQIVLVTALTGGSGVNKTNIEFWPPLNRDHQSWKPQIWYPVQTGSTNSFVRNSFVEDLTLNNADGADQYTLNFMRAANCWARRVQIKNLTIAGIKSTFGFRNEYRDCLINETPATSPGGGYGYLSELDTTGDLIADCVFNRHRAGVLFDLGTCASVVVDTLFTNQVLTFASGSAYLGADISYHSGFPSYCLAEGNVLMRTVPDFVHGNSGMNTWYRNWVQGIQNSRITNAGTVYTNSTAANWAVEVNAFSLSNNFVGNAIGTLSFPFNFGNLYPDSGFNGSTGTKELLVIGYWSQGLADNPASTNPNPYKNGDTNVWSTMHFHGNWLSQSNVVDWKAGFATNLPDSLVWSAAPFYWKTANLTWPHVGSDFLSTSKNYAQYRWDNGTFYDRGAGPTISVIADQVLLWSTSTGPLAFTIGDAETPAANLILRTACSNTTLLPLAGIVIGGSGANRTLTLTPTALQTGTATVQLTCMDEDGLTFIRSVVLDVHDNTFGATRIGRLPPYFREWKN